MTTIRLAAGIILLAGAASNLTGQEFRKSKDFSTRWELEATKRISREVDLTGELEQRFHNNSLQYDRTQATLSGEYRIAEFLDVSVGYRVLLESDQEDGISMHSRGHLDLKGTYGFGEFEFSLRDRIQYGFVSLSGRSDPGKSKGINRFRLRVQQHVFGTRIGWTASVEPWYLLNGRAGSTLTGMRFAAGIRYNLDFISRLSLRFIREEEFNVTDPLQSNILQVGYSRDL